MADKWKMLAAEFEAAQSLLRTMSEMEFGTSSQSCEPYEALPSALRLRRFSLFGGSYMHPDETIELASEARA
jgi:hypothetical protein